MIVDTHTHVSDRWYEPCESLLYQMDRCDVERAWLVQMLGHYENAYQIDACRRYPDRFVNIAGVDWTRDDGVAQLHRLADAGVGGVRLRPGSRSPGEDPLAIWRSADSIGLIVSCVGTAAQFADRAFAELATAFPKLPIVLEHLGGIARPDVGDVSVAVPAVAALAEHPMIHLKLPGLGQVLPRASLPPSGAEGTSDSPVAVMLAAFGPERLMWGSDFPVVSSREGYANALSWTVATLPAAARLAIFGGNAEALASGGQTLLNGRATPVNGERGT